MKIKIVVGTALLGLILFHQVSAQQSVPSTYKNETSYPSRFGFGRLATTTEIALWDIDVRPDGKGLPAGQGDVLKGKVIYTSKCMACHGNNDTDLSKIKLPAPLLISDTLAKSRPKAIGNYWPYATTLFDYIRRTMPYNQPGSLTDNEVYSITAYLLYANKIIKQNQLLNAKTLPGIVMPAKKLFIMDDRKGGPEVR
jgi:cytochrome c